MISLSGYWDSFDGYEPIYEINRSCIWKLSKFWLAMEVGWTVRLNVVESVIDNQYLYTPSIHQKAWESRHTYGEILMLLVPFHSSVHNDRIPKLI